MTNPYALGQLAAAFSTATTHEDPGVRRRADRRARRWERALQEMADGRVVVGSRSPVTGLPTWATLDVLRGGFALGSASAETPLQPDEIALARRVGILASRGRIFGYFVTDTGVHELNELLDSGAYRVELPEDAALLTIAWLLRAGARESAMDVLDAVSPFADRFRFAPKAASAPTSPPDHVYRITAGDAAAILRARRRNPRVEAQREALTVWNPFADRVLALWLEKHVDGRVDVNGDPDWRSRATALVDEYDRLAAVHTRCSKHRQPKENLAILVRALRTAADGRELLPRDAGLLHRAVEASVRKRGTPGSDRHARLRHQQQAVACAPAHRQLAAVAAERLRVLDPAGGIERPEDFLGDVTPPEADQSGVAQGSTMPEIVPRVLARAQSAPVEELLENGVVPSAEVLAELVPRISATVVASGFADPRLARLAAANYSAFRRRRSLLLLNLEKQVQLSELPWVRAVVPYSNVTTDEAMAVARRVGGLALDYFPATIIPNPLIQELQHLLGAAGHDVPLVEELAADIFMGRFSDKFRRAAQAAARVVGGTVYTRYFDIDTDQVLGLAAAPDPSAASRRTWRRARPSVRRPTFADLCWARAGRSPDDRWSVAANGTVIEQSQILTTHNLATLVSLGVLPTRPWVDLARASVDRTSTLLALASRQPRPLPTVKDAAYAWRQAIFYLSVADPAEAQALIDDDAVAASGPAVMGELFAGLREAAAGRPAVDRHRAPFVGWTVGRHWILDALGHGG